MAARRSFFFFVHQCRHFAAVTPTTSTFAARTVAAGSILQRGQTLAGVDRWRQRQLASRASTCCFPGNGPVVAEAALSTRSLHSIVMYSSFARCDRPKRLDAKILSTCPVYCSRNNREQNELISANACRVIEIVSTVKRVRQFTAGT